MSTPKERVLPGWLKDFSQVVPAEECFVKLEKSPKCNAKEELGSEHKVKSSTPIETTRRYNTRQRANGSCGDTKESLKRHRVDRAQVECVNPPAFIEYNGKVEYCTEFNDISLASAHLLNWVNKQTSHEKIPIGFDMEWPFTFVTGPGKTAVIQLCADVDLCYIFHVSGINRLPASLVFLLTHDKVCLHGVNVKNDCRKLERDYKEINSQKMIDQCIDLGVYCNRVCNTSGRWSMERLVWYLCRLKINKDKSVRNSKWHIKPLSANQQLYAAIDVYIAQIMFAKLKLREIEKETETKKFIDEFGSVAFEAKQKLL